MDQTTLTVLADASRSRLVTEMADAEPVDAQAIAEVSDPQPVARLAAQARAQSVMLLGPGRIVAGGDETPGGGHVWRRRWMAPRLWQARAADRNTGNSRNGPRTNEVVDRGKVQVHGAGSFNLADSSLVIPLGCHHRPNLAHLLAQRLG
jgi:hypothetical protein